MLSCSTCGFESESLFRFCPECGAEPADTAPSREQRKTVTVLFCDLTCSTALGETVDAEQLRALLARYFDEMNTTVERHGGTVEKFIGDAVMAVQGDANADLAEVLSLGGKPDEAAAALGHALERYERKGNLVSAGRTRERLAEVQNTAAQ